MNNSHPRILLYLCKKHNIDCRNLIEYINDREYFLNKISNDRKEAKTLILQMINGGFKNKYSDNNDIDNDKTMFNYKGKSLSRIFLELENKILQVMIDFLNSKIFKYLL